MLDQILLGVGIVTALVLFIWGKLRHDLIAMIVLLGLVIVGVVPTAEAFTGFGHPAVITVAAVLIASQGLKNSGLVQILGTWAAKCGKSVTAQATTLSGLTAIFSSFMNNVGAVAVMMPVAVQLARSCKRPPSLLLMPLAFASLLGGMSTLIGTPPNMIIGGYRQTAMGEPFRMFDFFPVGACLAVVGVAFCGVVGWRLLPRREPATSREDLFEVEAYSSELLVPEESKAIGVTLRDLAQQVDGDITVMGLQREGRMISMPWSRLRFLAGDVLVVEANAATIKAATDQFGLKVKGDKELRKEFLESSEIEVVEAIVQPGGLIEGKTIAELDLRRVYGVNLLAVARRGKRVTQRLKTLRLEAADILLIQGDEKVVPRTLTALGCLPLAFRDLGVGRPRRIALAAGLFIGAIALTVAGLLPVEVALSACALLMTLFRLVPLRQLYEAVDWSVIVLLGAMIPIGSAMEGTGAAERVAELMLNVLNGAPGWLLVGGLIFSCMALTNFINNAAAAILMAPIATYLARGMDISVDALLMATAVGVSGDFLTPIGHQSNTLVMGPGGYRFSDYLRLGLPVALITLVVGTAAILWWWPLHAPQP